MKHLIRKITCFLLAATMIMSLSGCSVLKDLLAEETEREYAGDHKPEWGYGSETTEETETTTRETEETTEPSETDETKETSGTTVPGGSRDGKYIRTSNELTYPDHVASYDEVHPKHAPGNLKNEEAVARLNEVESTILKSYISCYVDADILFENPEKVGITGIDAKNKAWGGVSVPASQYPEKKAFYEKQRDLLLEIDYETLKTDDRLCYDKLLYDIEENIYCYSFTAFEYYTMIFNSLVGPQSEVFFLLDVFTFDSVKDAENYIYVLKDIDRYYDEMCEYEETRAKYGFASSAESYEAAAESFDKLLEQRDDCFLYKSFEERLDKIKGLSSADRERLIKENEDAMKNVVFPEFEECAKRMRALKSAGGQDAGLTEYRGGDAYLAVLTRLQTNSSKTVEETVKTLDSEIDRIEKEMRELKSHSSDWKSEYNAHKYSKGTVNQNLDFLREAVKKDFPSIPAHQYYLMEVPKVFEKNFSPAAYLGFHLDNFDSNMIIVNNRNVDKDFGTTLAHEGYPGHMFQSLYTRAHTKHVYMYVSGSIGYKEGWATYCENYSARYFSGNGMTDAAKYVVLDNDLTLLLETRIDFGIHYEGWDIDTCVKYLNMHGLWVTKSSLQRIYTLLVCDPCYFVKYGMGYVWTKNIMDNARSQFPKATEKQIHTAYLNGLTGTFDQIEANMKKSLK
ncbi:MAG: DUF885 family protein [Clostridiales bacterium]|nr:DUF885 family protein [Clostridiales bacterium]